MSIKIYQVEYSKDFKIIKNILLKTFSKDLIDAYVKKIINYNYNDDKILDFEKEFYKIIYDFVKNNIYSQNNISLILTNNNQIIENKNLLSYKTNRNLPYIKFDSKYNNIFKIITIFYNLHDFLDHKNFTHLELCFHNQTKLNFNLKFDTYCDNDIIKSFKSKFNFIDKTTVLYNISESEKKYV